MMQNIGSTRMKPTIKRLAGCVGGALLAAGLGGTLWYAPFGQRLSDLSYDLPFATRGALVTPEIVLIFIDRASHDKYSLPSGLIDRRAHVELLQRLTRDGARMVFYDIVFSQPMPEVDPAFAEAMRAHGNVVLGCFEMVTSHGHGFITELVQPNATLRDAAQHYGLLMVGPPDSKRAVRQLFTGDHERPTAAWVAAQAIDKTLANRLDERWLNYYGIPPAFPSTSLSAALAQDLPGEFFRNKIVFVGALPEIAPREKFATPWKRYGVFATGVEVIATSLGNLLQRNWLRRASPGWQFSVIVGFGLLAGAGLSLLRPWAAAGCALGIVVLLTGSAIYLQYAKNLWWSWMIPVAAQTPVALVWSVGYQYALSSRRERQMKKAFSAYLSPHLVKRIAASDFELSLGGKEVEATILFTDLEGFTPMSESLPPNEVSRILTGYFERITKHILEHEGTIIKYVGDAVMAVWGAPLEDSRHAERAVLAARGISQTSQGELFSGRRLRTRIGINTGKALAGNLGSSFRFDYTVIGATTNLANRLEGLNKVLGTDILIADATRRQLPGNVSVRNLGQFILRGTTEPVRVHEVLPTDDERAWVKLFGEALEHWQRREWKAAGSLMHKVIALRGGHDGPSEFYLRLLERGEPLPEGAVKIETK